MLYCCHKHDVFFHLLLISLFAFLCGDNEMLYSQKIHPLLLGNPNMLHGPSNYTVDQNDFHNHNQFKVHLLFGWTVGKLGPHFFLELIFLKTSAFLMVLKIL